MLVKELYLKKAIGLGLIKGNKQVETVIRKLANWTPEHIARLVNRLDDIASVKRLSKSNEKAKRLNRASKRFDGARSKHGL